MFVLIRTQENTKMCDAQNAVDGIKRLLDGKGLGDVGVDIMDWKMEELSVVVLSGYK